MNGGLRVLLGSLALAGAVPAWAVERAKAADAGNEQPLVVTADQVVIADGVAHGNGHVALKLGGQAVSAARFSLDVDGGSLVLEEGTWQRPEGAVVFARAVIDLGDASGTMVQARQQEREGRWRVSAGTLTWSADGTRAAAEGASLTLCSCDKPLWSVEAREVDVVVDDVARFRAGWVRVCDTRVLPVPVGAVALADRRTGLLVPQIAWGRDGVVAAAPVMVVLGDHADAVVAPEWRQRRGARGTGALRYALSPGEGGTVQAAGGWDTAGETWRGQAAVDHGWAPGAVRTALRGGWVSDDAVITDFGEDILARTAPWSEIQGVAGMGPVRLETDQFVADVPLRQRPIGVALVGPAMRLGPVALGGQTRVDTLSQGAAFAPQDAFLTRFSGRGAAEWGRWQGPVRFGVRTDAAGFTWEDDAPMARARVAAESALGLWGDLKGVRHLAEVGGVVDAGINAGEGTPRFAEEEATRAWGVGPSVRSTWLGPSSVPVVLYAAAPWTPRGWEPSANLRLRARRWSARAQADADVQQGAVARDDGLTRAGLGVVHGRGLFWGDGELAANLPGALAAWRPGYRMRADIGAVQWRSHGPTIRYRSPCDCLSLDAGATWSADRDVPDVLFQLQLR